MYIVQLWQTTAQSDARGREVWNEIYRSAWDDSQHSDANLEVRTIRDRVNGMRANPDAWDNSDYFVHGSDTRWYITVVKNPTGINSAGLIRTMLVEEVR